VQLTFESSFLVSDRGKDNRQKSKRHRTQEYESLDDAIRVLMLDHSGSKRIGLRRDRLSVIMECSDSDINRRTA